MKTKTIVLALLAALAAAQTASFAHAARAPKFETRWAFRMGAASAWQPIVGDTSASMPIVVPAGSPWGCTRQRVQTSSDGRYASGSIVCAYGDAMAIASVQCAVGALSADTSTVGIATMKGGPTILLNVQCETKPAR
jgi:hypothetical protein